MTIVVGTGPAGLTAAYLLAKRGEKVTVIDKAKQPGGLWRGFDYGTHHFETGMHWYSDAGISEIDEFWWNLLPFEDLHLIPREIAGCWWNGKLQTNSPYPDVRGGLEFSNRPVLEKIWGVPIEELAPYADKLVKIDRGVAYDAHQTAIAYEADPRSREMLAWPDQRTLPVQYQSGRRSFYPKKGLIELVTQAMIRLSDMGVEFHLGRSFADFAHHRDDRVVWASGLKPACDAHGIPWPSDMTPPRRLTVVNALVDIGAMRHVAHLREDHADLHYAFDYEPDNDRFRVTWYHGVTHDRNDRRVTVELLGDYSGLQGEITAKCMNFGSMDHVLGVHDLGPILPVPTVKNEALLEGVRYELGRKKNLIVIGSGAKPGLFFQPEIMAHLYEAIA